MREFNLNTVQENEFSVSEDPVLHEFIGKEYSPVADIPEAVRAALSKPIDSPPLNGVETGDGGTVLI